MFNTSVVYRLFSWAVDLYTETQDFVRAVFRALPEELQRGVGRYETGLQVKIIYENQDQLDLQQMVFNIIINQIEDHIIGKINSEVAAWAIENGLYSQIKGLQWALKNQKRDFEQWKKDQ